MTLVRPDDLQEVLFVLNDIEYRTDARRGDIVHEAFHNALPVEYTAGHRLTFRSADGTELFADNFVGEIADTFGAVTILAAALQDLGERLASTISRFPSSIAPMPVTSSRMS